MVRFWQDQLLKLLAAETRTGEFVGASGRKLDGYLDCRPVLWSSKGQSAAVRAIIEHYDSQMSSYAGFAGPGYGAAALIAGLLAYWAPIARYNGVLVRAGVKDHGTGSRLVGRVQMKAPLLLGDDVATTGGSLVDAVQVLREAGAVIEKALVLVDREQGAKERLEAVGVTLEALFTFQEVLGAK